MADILKKRKHQLAAESKGSLSNFNFKNMVFQVNKLFWNWHPTKKFFIENLHINSSYKHSNL